jgi:hypothetical protein
MPYDRAQRGPQDRTHVNVNQGQDLHYWAKHFGVTEEQLREAVRHVGNRTGDVEKFLWHKAAKQP